MMQSVSMHREHIQKGKKTDRIVDCAYQLSTKHTYITITQSFANYMEKCTNLNARWLNEDESWVRLLVMTSCM